MHLHFVIKINLVALRQTDDLGNTQIHTHTHTHTHTHKLSLYCLNEYTHTHTHRLYSLDLSHLLSVLQSEGLMCVWSNISSISSSASTGPEHCSALESLYAHSVRQLTSGGQKIYRREEKQTSTHCRPICYEHTHTHTLKGMMIIMTPLLVDV